MTKLRPFGATGPRMTLGLAFAGLGMAAFAQSSDDAVPGGQSLVLTTRTGVEISEDTDVFSSVGLQYATQTRDQRLTIGARTGLDYAFGDADSNLSQRTPRFSLDYERNNGATKLTFGATYARRDVNGRVPIDPTLPTFLATDFISDDGERTDYSISAGLEFGMRDPFGGSITASQASRTFDDTDDPELVDVDTRQIDAQLRFTLRPTLTVRATYSYQEQVQDDAIGTERIKQTAGISATYVINPALTVDAGLRYVQNDLDAITVFGPLTISETSIEGDLSLALDRPNGRYLLQASRNQQPLGALDTVLLTRTLDFPNGGGLTATAGVTAFPSEEIKAIGSLSYSQEIRPGGDAALSIERAGDFDADEAELVRTRLSGSYSQVLTPLSTISLTAGYASLDYVAPGGDRDVADIGINYTTSLTPDWGLTMGARATQTREDNVGSDTDSSIFLTINRDFRILN